MLTRQLPTQVEQTPPPAYQSPEEHRPTSSNAPASEFASDAREEPEVTAPITQSPQVPQEEQASSPVEPEGLRQRKGITPADDKPSVSQVAPAVAPRGTEGVPIQIVATLCLVSFLLAYFFF